MFKKLLFVWLLLSLHLFGVEIIFDDAKLLTNQKQLIDEYIKYNQYLAKTYDIDLRVVTTNTTSNIDIFTYKKFKELQTDTRSESGRMLLLVLNPKQDKVRLEVSKALEGIYTDGFVSYIERKGFVPYFQENKIADGIFMAMELIKDKAYEAQKNGSFAPKMATGSIGGGAKSDAKIAQRDPHAKQGKQVSVASNEQPIDIMNKYLDVLKQHNKNPNLNIYTTTTQQFFNNWVVTDINQDHERETTSRCLRSYETLYDTTQQYAVLAVLPYDEHRKCAPYFFHREDGVWKLDIASMAQMIRFNVDMQWHFDLSKRLDAEGIYYAYAFDGYGFDKNGYPFRPKDLKPSKYRWGFSCGKWAYPQEMEKAKQEPKKYYRCWINNYTYGMPANVRLGLDVYDYIMAVGEGADRIENVTFVEFMNYMKTVPSGSMVRVDVYHRGENIVRRGIAP